MEPVSVQQVHSFRKLLATEMKSLRGFGIDRGTETRELLTFISS